MSNASSRPLPDEVSASASAAANILGRWLHFGVALCIVLCLLLAVFAECAQAEPRPLASLVAFNLHKFIGLNALLLVLLFLVWSALGHARSPADLFPWFSPKRLKSIAGEIAGLPRDLHAPASAAMVQGAGIALALIAAASGLALVLLSLAADSPAPQRTPFSDAFAAVHFRASLGLGAYLAVHVIAVVVHAARGHAQRCARMFHLLNPD